MNAVKLIRTYLLLCNLVVILQPVQALVQQNSDASKTSLQHPTTERDGQHDFDFEIGNDGQYLALAMIPEFGTAVQPYNRQANLHQQERIAP